MFPFNLFDLFNYSEQEKELPENICGYKVDYRSPISEPCPGCGGQTYRYASDRGIACCTGCNRILRVFPDY